MSARGQGSHGAGSAAHAGPAGPKPRKTRIDDLLVERGFFESRDLAARAVFAGEVTSNDVHVTAPSQMVAPGIALRVRGRSRFVSRGGDKLQGALDDTGFRPQGLNCIDAGSSSGGFTDCLLQNGAARVAAVDVGYGIIDSSLRSDPRVALFERTNIRDVDVASLGGPFDLLVADLSFISLSGLLAGFRALVKPDGHLLALVKPQFEARREAVEEGGVVTDPAEHARVLEQVLDELAAAGFGPLSLHASHLRGGKAGNREFFVLAGPPATCGSGGADASAAPWRDSIDIWNAVGLPHGGEPLVGGEDPCTSS